MRTSCTCRSLKRRAGTLFLLATFLTTHSACAEFKFSLPDDVFSSLAKRCLDDLFRPTLHVSPTGRAGWSGKLAEPNEERTDGPLPSIQAARDRLRQMRAAGEALPDLVIIEVQPGTYFLDSPLTFGPEDAGNDEGGVLYGCPDGERAVISGGRTVTGWRDVEVNGKQAWAADLPEVKAGDWYFRQLFVNGQRRARPRLPKEGFHRFAGLPQLRQGAPYNEGHDQANFEPGHIRNWRNLADVEVVVLHFWVSPRMRIAELDESANLVRFTQKTGRRLTDSFHMDRFARYYVDNVLEALTEPGEWYLDRPSGTLYYIPLPGETRDNVTVIAPRLRQLVRVAGEAEDNKPVQRLGLFNLSFEHAEWYDDQRLISDGQASTAVPGAVYFENARTCVFSGCAVRRVSNYGIEVGKGCRDIGIENCELTDLGAGGVKIGHGSDATTFTNNEVGPGGAIFHNAVGVWIGHSNDNVVTHNNIHHLYYTGVSVGWSWGYAPSKAARNAIEYNHIHHIGQGWLGDMAGIYTLGVSPGTTLRYNFIHDIEADPYGGWGLYNDEGSTDILMENNVVYRTTHGGYHQHYGRENILRNNVLAFGREAQLMRTRDEDHISFLIFRNIVCFTEPKLLGSNWKNDRYLMDFNLYWRVGGEPFDFAGASLEEWQRRGHDVHSLIADPMFEDPNQGDFRLKPESPALKIGFQPIDTSQIGRQPPPQ